MTLRGGILLSFVLVAVSLPALAQPLRLRTKAPALAVQSKEEVSPWSASVRYSVLTDYADSRSPRGYNNAFTAGLGYQFDRNWSLEFEGGVRAETINGQIYKGAEQSYEEVVSASTSMALTYEQVFNKRHRYSFFAHGEPLWDEASRLEGYKGIVGGGGDLTFTFFNKVYSVTNFLDVSELMNTYRYGSDLRANPNYFVTYKFINGLRIYDTWKFTVNFGLKATHYLDDFWGYSYQSSFGLSKSWGGFAASLSYDSGGFTDDGQVRLWYLNEYRRIARFGMSYAF